MTEHFQRTHVLAFIAAVDQVELLFRGQYGGVKDLSDVIRLARRREIPRKGKLVGGHEFEVHGAGCLVIDRTGRIVDVDFLEARLPIFDGWRLQRFAASSGVDLADVGEILEICRALVSEGVLKEPREGWFAVSQREMRPS